MRGCILCPVQLQGTVACLQDAPHAPQESYWVTFLKHLDVGKRTHAGTMVTPGIDAHAVADAGHPQVQIMENSFRVVHGHGIAAITKGQSKGRNAWEKKWLQGVLVLCLLALQVSSLVLS